MALVYDPRPGDLPAPVRGNVMKVLSLFDGMACGYLAMQRAGVEVESYDAYEIDKYTVKTAQHNFPDIQEHGDVFAEDFTKYRGNVDFLVGGSPCTYWSIAQTKNRETTASGLGWDLFSQYVRALHEAQPRFFIYENNKSMAKAIRDQIRETFGFEEICINSALVSAQNRQRFYWVGKRNEDGTYSKVDVQQPEDLGILLKDVLDGVGSKELSEHEMDYMVRETKDGRNHFDYDYHQDATQDKGRCLTSNVSKGVPYNVCCEPVPFRQTANGKGFCLDASYTKTPGSPATFLEGGHARANRSMVAEPARVGCMPSPDGTVNNAQGFRIYAEDGKSVTLRGKAGGAGGKTGLYAVPVNTTEAGKAGTLRATCYKDGVRNLVANDTDRKTGVAELVATSVRCRGREEIGGKWEARVDGKNGAMTANTVGINIAEPVSESNVTQRFHFENGDDIVVHSTESQYATPCEWDDNGIPTKAISGADGKTYTVYPVQDGQITIKGKTYPIKLVDGYYIIRKLTVSECKRLQTVPEWYDFSCVSATQAYKMLGNGWTVDVIAHLIKSCVKEANHVDT